MIISELEKSIGYDEHKFDWHIGAGELESQDGSLTWRPMQLTYTRFGLTEQLVGLSYTDWSFGQVCTKLRIPSGYLSRCPRFLQDTNINYWLRAEENHDREFLVRGYDDKLRAFLSDRYVPIANSSVLRAVCDVVDSDLRYQCHVDPDYIYLKLFAMNTPDNLFAMGVVVVNGEVGNYAFRIAPFIQYTRCSNSVVFLASGFYMRHVSQHTLAYISATVKENVAVCLGLCGDHVERAIQAETERLEDISDVIDNICLMRGYNTDVKRQIIVGTQGEMTKAAVVQGLSYAAHEVLDPTLTMDLESVAGYYLMGGIPEKEQVD